MIRTALLVLFLVASITAAQPKILQPGTFHGSEVTVSGGDGWLALHPDERVSILRRERVSIEPAYDPYVDADHERSGREVKVASTREPLLLISGLPLEEGAVETVVAGTRVLLPGNAITLELSGRKYMLVASAMVEFGPYGEPLYSDYELVLTDGEREQVLLELPGLDDAAPTLLWAGDLDRDGELDLLLDTTHHYNVRRPALFLSGSSDEASFVTEVAAFRTVGC